MGFTSVNQCFDFLTKEKGAIVFSDRDCGNTVTITAGEFHVAIKCDSGGWRDFTRFFLCPACHALSLTLNNNQEI